MKRLAPFLTIIAALLAPLISSAAEVPFKLNIAEISLHQEANYWVSDWSEVIIPAGLEAFQIVVNGSPETYVHITDLIAPDGKIYVQSDGSTHLSQYSEPVLRNVISLNRSESGMQGLGTLIVPNNPELGKPPGGVWRFRTLSKDEPLVKKISARFIGKTEKDLLKNKLNIRVWISPGSYWEKTPQQVKKMLDAAKVQFKEIGIVLEVLSVNKLDSAATEPMKLPDDMVSIALLKNEKDAVNVYLMPTMEFQNKPVNGLACIGGPIDLPQPNPCFVSMYATDKADSISLQSQSKILTHELGHYLGLYHTRDEGYYLIGSVLDHFSDTPEIVTGSNMMDPGIHDQEPYFSPQQIQMLLLSPVLKF